MKNKKMKQFLSVLSITAILGSTALMPVSSNEVKAESLNNVSINEIAWMGTSISYSDEWLELYNDSNKDIDLTGWTLGATDGSPSIQLSGVIPAKGYFLMEKTDDNSVADVLADLIYSGSLSNTSEVLELRDGNGLLVDTVDAWYAGDNTSKATMERVSPLLSGTDSANWVNGSEVYNGGLGTPKAKNSSTSELRQVVVNEVAWMGTNNSYSDEWMELYNNSSVDIDLTGWTLNTQDGTPSINLSGVIPAQGYFLLEKTDDNSVTTANADLVYSGSLGNTGEFLELRDSNGVLVDTVDNWYAGDNDTKATMERVNSNEFGSISSNWVTATEVYADGLGTPKAPNNETTSDSGSTDGSTGDSGSTDTTTGTNICNDNTERLNNVSEELHAINVYFNKCALTEYSLTGNETNYNVNLEDRLIHRLNQATTTIDFATYEINLPRVVDTLITKASEGVDVRVIADAKDGTDPHYAERYETMRLYVEKMVRGKDGIVGTNDDIYVFSDSPMLVVEDSTKRANFGLPTDFTDFSYGTYTIGSSTQTGYLFVDAEQQSDGSYYSPGVQMHNKFAVVDDTWVFTGSWNFTVTGLYGTEENMANGVLGGNQQHVVEVHASEVANAYETEFNEMWGSSTLTPDAMISNFGTGKTDNTQHVFNVGGKTVEVYFAVGDDPVGKVTQMVKNEADLNTYFSIFAWSDQALVDELKHKYEGSYNDLEGTLTGFDVKGLFDASFWNQWWSASVDMTGRTASQTSVNNPNTRWANPAPVYKGNEDRKLHSKTMLIDADTNSDPTVILGSTNWSNNGNNVNDENMIVIRDTEIVNQFVQEFNARYVNAGGTIQ